MLASRKFPKSERLRNDNFIAALFKHGKRAHSGEFLFIHLLYNNPLYNNEIEEKTIKQSSKIKFFVGVRKKEFKHAVKRNRVRRLIKESYRNNKNLLDNFPISDGKMLFLGILYIGKTVPTYSECCEKIHSFITNNILN